MSSLSPAQLNEIKVLLRAANKVDAVKQYRLYTRAGHFEATDAVDAIAAEMEVGNHKEERVSKLNPSTVVSKADDAPFDPNADILFMCLQGQYQQAVQLFSQRYNVSEQVAQEAVEKISKNHPVAIDKQISTNPFETFKPNTTQPSNTQEDLAPSQHSNENVGPGYFFIITMGLILLGMIYWLVAL